MADPAGRPASPSRRSWDQQPRASGTRDAGPHAVGAVPRHLPLVLLLLVGAAGRVGQLVEARADLLSPQLAEHLLGLGLAAVTYVLQLRWGVWAWLAAAATAPYLLEPVVWASERRLLAETPYVLAGLVVLLACCWRARPGAAVPLAGMGALGLLAALRSAAPEQRLPGTDSRGRVARTDASPVDLVTTLLERVATPAPVLAVGLALGLAGAVGLGRAGAARMRTPCLLVLAAVVALPLGGAAHVGLSWQDLLAVVVLAPAAGALGLTALLRGRRDAATARPQADAVDAVALADFAARYGYPVLAPVTVVVAAYDEAEGIGPVLDRLPGTIDDHPVDVLVVDDGSTDRTAAVVQQHGSARVVRCPLNRGQGAALRLGYRIAREHGARYVVSTDADGQYHADDLPRVLAPVLDDRADFVSGSRRLGAQHTRDRFRQAGVYLFAWTVNAMTGSRVTDTSFGLRAMRADITAEVTLNQPQYQSAELLIGVLSHGFRVAEVPAILHQRTAGTTRKGRNLVYGARYARVVWGTWWREGCPRPVADCAPALIGRPLPDVGT